jgi:hypothetical protein
LARVGTSRSGAPRRPAPCGEQRLLEQILGVLRRADDPVDVQPQLTPVRVSQLAECVLVAGARTDQGLLGHARIRSLTLPFAAITGNDLGPHAIRRSVLIAADASINATTK